MEVFSANDAATGDSISFELDGDRLSIRTKVEGHAQTLIVIRRGVGLSLACALLNALDESTPLRSGRSISL